MTIQKIEIMQPNGKIITIVANKKVNTIACVEERLSIHVVYFNGTEKNYIGMPFIVHQKNLCK